ncbi:MAG: MogA/MoaB family molybdenum cofactor biosynthesis protein [Dehalococcoidia bacterium]|nr:MAG: MogA/MoaB family molybdenum cofactor biosynthesis protein [Dehalococcoidia bacterium]
MPHRHRAAVLTVSDLGSRGQRIDTAGPAVEALLGEAGFEVAERALLPDEPDQIATLLRKWADEADIALAVTAGGTGLSPRDRTPEATLAVIDYRVPGMEEAMRAASVVSVPTAMLSRAVCGVRGRTLIVNLPGSERGARENLSVLLPVLGHACSSLRGDAEESADTHARLQGSQGSQGAL